ncbi:MAG: DUF6151 family protein [Parvularculaceae bacterium]
MTDLNFQCRCGEVKGVARDAGGPMGIRVICYCADCQAFAHFLGCEDEYLDAAGGSDIYQTSPSRLEITQGMDLLKSVVVGPDARLHRFYASCCKTPIVNTIPGRKLPFAGTLVRNYDPSRRERLFGDPKTSVFASAANGDPPTKAQIATPFLIFNLMRRAAREWMSGNSKKNVFLDAEDSGKVTPQFLSAEERSALDARAVESARKRAARL